MVAAHNQQLIAQAAAFKAQLESFAKRHSRELENDEMLRSKFQRMCSALGVDVMMGGALFSVMRHVPFLQAKRALDRTNTLLVSLFRSKLYQSW